MSANNRLEFEPGEVGIKQLGKGWVQLHKRNRRGVEALVLFFFSNPFPFQPSSASEVHFYERLVDIGSFHPPFREIDWATVFRAYLPSGVRTCNYLIISK